MTFGNSAQHRPGAVRKWLFIIATALGVVAVLAAMRIHLGLLEWFGIPPVGGGGLAILNILLFCMPVMFIVLVIKLLVTGIDRRPYAAGVFVLFLLVSFMENFMLAFALEVLCLVLIAVEAVVFVRKWNCKPKAIAKNCGSGVLRHIILLLSIAGLASCTSDAGTCSLDPQNCLIQISNLDLEIIQVSLQKQNQMLQLTVDVQGGQEFNFCETTILHPISDSLIPLHEIGFIAVSAGKIPDDGFPEIHSSFSFVLDSVFWSSGSLVETSETIM